jgi:phosphatidylglycerophosphate synthase
MQEPQTPPDASFGAEVARIYRESRKPRDIFWNVWVARPIAALLLYFLRRTPLTPNQVSFLGAFLFIGVALALVGVAGAPGMLLAALALQVSYWFDCADGQLARLKGMTSPVGMYLDFLIDEFKALLLVAACGVRLWRFDGREAWLIAGLIGVMMVAVATSLTTFVRRQEYSGQEIKPGVHQEKPIPGSLVGKLVWLAERGAQWLVHYPSWFHYVALAALVLPPWLDGAAVFFALFMGVYALYIARTGLAIFLKLASPNFYKNRESN